MRSDNALNDYLAALRAKPVEALGEPEIVVNGIDGLRLIDASRLKVGTLVRVRLPECRFREIYSGKADCD